MSPCTSIAEVPLHFVVVPLQDVVLLLAVLLQEVLLFFISYFFFLSKLKKRPKLKTSRLLWPRYQTRSEKVSGLK